MGHEVGSIGKTEEFPRAPGTQGPRKVRLGDWGTGALGHVMNIRQRTGQSFLEFSFAIIMVVLLMVGMVKVFLWTGSDLVNRRQAHEDILTNIEGCSLENIKECGGPSMGLRQLRPVFYIPEETGAAVSSNIFGN